MKLGYPNNPRRDLVPELEWIARAGFDFVDLNLEPDKCAVGAVDPALVASCIRRLGLGVMGHLAWYLPVGAAMPQLRRAAAETAGLYLEAFSIAGVRRVTVHANWPNRLFTASEGIAFQIETIGEMMKTAGGLGIRLLYEHVPSEHDSPEHAAAVLDALPGLGFHLDVGHANLSRFPVERWIERLASRLEHVHLHDNDGRNDLHLPPGTGNLPGAVPLRALKAAGYDGTITIEVFSSDRDYALLAMRKAREAWLAE